MGRNDKPCKPVDLSKVTRYSISRRRNKTNLKSFGRPMKKIRGVDFFESLPDFLKASDLIRFIDLITAARKKDKPFHLLLGAHNIKVGLSPVLIDLFERKIVTSLSFNCAGIIHDLELAFFGGTSEDVRAGLADGSFGMVKETGDMFADICNLADTQQIGLGEACGKFINANKAPHRKLSIFASAERLGVPVTVHIGIGSDIVAQHPGFDGAKAGAASHHDFRVLCDICTRIDRGGVLANIGSAVLLPEVFLKALTVARNLKKGKSRLTTANFDMIVHYRPMENIVNRPTYGVGEGFNFVGHHEIMVPLLAWGLKSKLSLQ